jgi:hypothetical protein
MMTTSNPVMLEVPDITASTLFTFRLVLANSSDPVQRSSAHRAFVTALPAGQNTGVLPLACLQSHITR